MARFLLRQTPVSGEGPGCLVTLMGKLDQIYARLPVWGQHAAVTAFGVYWHRLRFGGNYARMAQAYRARERYTAEQWREYQSRELQSLLRLSAERVPYYQNAWSKEQKAAAGAGDLKALPLLEKDPIRADPESFLRRDREPRSEERRVGKECRSGWAPKH